MTIYPWPISAAQRNKAIFTSSPTAISHTHLVYVRFDYSCRSLDNKSRLASMPLEKQPLPTLNPKTLCNAQDRIRSKRRHDMGDHTCSRVARSFQSDYAIVYICKYSVIGTLKANADYISALGIPNCGRDLRKQSDIQDPLHLMKQLMLFLHADCSRGET